MQIGSPHGGTGRGDVLIHHRFGDASRTFMGMRKAIFGRGFLQVGLCGALLTFAGIYILNLPKEVAFIAGMGFTLSSTAIVMQVLEETRNYEHTKRPTGDFNLNL